MLKKLFLIIFLCGNITAMEKKPVLKSEYGFVLMDAQELDKVFAIKENGFGALVKGSAKIAIDINTHVQIINTFAIRTFEGAEVDSFLCHDRQSKINFALFEKKKSKNGIFPYVSFTFEKNKIKQYIKKHLDDKAKVISFATIEDNGEEVEFTQRIMADLEKDREGTLKKLQAAVQMAKMEYFQTMQRLDNQFQAN